MNEIEKDMMQHAWNVWAWLLAEARELTEMAVGWLPPAIAEAFTPLPWARDENPPSEVEEMRRCCGVPTIDACCETRDGDSGY